MLFYRLAPYLTKNMLKISLNQGSYCREGISISLLKSIFTQKGVFWSYGYRERHQELALTEH